MSAAADLVPRVRPASATVVRRLAAVCRFSLRELFLVVLVCAALAAWGHGVLERNRPIRPSKMAEYFTTVLSNDVVAVRAEIGEQGDAWWSGQAPPPPWSIGQHHRWADSKLARREWVCHLRLPRDKEDKFRDGLTKRIRTHLQMGEYVWQDELEVEGQVAGPNYLGISTQYHCCDVHGILRFYLVRADNQYATFIATLSERR
jgi:hypothetical protein